MGEILLSDLLKVLLLKKADGEVEGEVTGLAYHSGRIKPGNLFFTLPGRISNGWQYAGEAMQRGALAIVTDEEAPLQGFPLIRVPDVRLALALLADRYYEHPSRKFRLIGVTGTNGKTTTTHMVENLFRERGEVTGLLGTIGCRAGEESFPSAATTPEASDLQEMLWRMARKGVRHAAMEVSSHALEQKRVAGCQFAVAVLTNITGEHLDFHRSFEAYLEAKTKLFTAMDGAADDGSAPRVSVLNADDRYYEQVARRCSGQQITYGITKRAGVSAEEIEFSAQGVSFKARTFSGSMRFKLAIPGLFTVYNALAAICVGLIEGLSLAEINAALEKFKGVPGRFELVERGQDFLVVVDYAHTPDGLENVLKTARKLTGGRLITVFGCGGERDRSKRSLMGETAARYSDLVIVTNDNPRGEEPKQIFGEIEPGLLRCSGRDSYLIIPDRREAITEALLAARAGDLVLIAGKGHEEYQIFGDRVTPFSDHQVAGEIIAQQLLRRKQDALHHGK